MVLTPFVKETVLVGYVGVAPLGLEDAPLHATVWFPAAYVVTVLPPASWAVRVTLNAVPALAVAGAVTPNWDTDPTLTVTARPLPLLMVPSETTMLAEPGLGRAS